MLGVIPAALGVTAGGPRILVAPGTLGGVAFARASAAFALGADGTSWGSVGADLPRFHAAARRLLIEGARTNFIRNPRMEGGTAGTLGSGGAWPTSQTGPAGAVFGLTYARLANQTLNGITGMVFRVSGTATNISNAGNYYLDSGTQFNPAVGTTCAGGAYVALLAGSFVNVNGFELVSNGFAGGAVDLRSATATPSAYVVSGASTGACRLGWRLRAANLTGAIDFTVFIGWPSLTEGAFLSSPILPAAGATATSTRARDVLSVPVASQAGTLLVSGVVPAIGGVQTVAQADDGSAANRAFLRLDGTTALNLYAAAGGTTTGALSLGTVTSGTPFRAGMTWGTTGRVAAVGPSGTVQVQTGGPTSALVTLRLGDDHAGTGSLFGEFARAEYLPAALPDAALAARVAALP